MVIAHNVLAMNANRMFGINTTAKAKSTEKLSSGYKINRSADDAAGLAISEKMRRQIRGLTQASENCQDGVSFCQVADGALSEIDDMLHRMTELSVKSANETNTAEDKQYIDAEVQNLKQEMERVFENTSFNERRIWDIKSNGVTGTNPADRVPIGTKTIPLISIKATPMEITVTNSMAGAIPDNSRPSYNYYPIKFNASDEGFVIKWKGFNGKEYISNTVKWMDDISGNYSFELKDYMDYSKYPEAKGINFKFSYLVHESATRDEVINYINNVNLATTSRGRLNANFTFSDGIKHMNTYAVQYIDLCNLLRTGANLEDNDSSIIVGANGTGIINNPAKGGTLGSDLKLQFNLKNGGTITTDVRDDIFGNCSYYSNETGHIKGDTPISDNLLDDLHKLFEKVENTGIEPKTDMEIYRQYEIYGDSSFNDVKNRTGTFALRILNCKSYDEAVDYLNKLTSVSFTYKANSTIFKIEELDNAYGSVEVPIYADDDADGNVDGTGKTTISIQAGAEANQKIDIVYDSLRLKKLGLKDVNVLTVKNAQETIDAVKNALSVVSSQRSYFGATQNRLEHTIKNLDNVVENTTNAESQIRDTDMATEMVNMANLNILDQVGQSMLAQANQSKQGILSLLQ